MKPRKIARRENYPVFFVRWSDRDTFVKRYKQACKDFGNMLWEEKELIERINDEIKNYIKTESND